MKSTNPRFSETDVTFAVKERLGWDDINVFPESVYIEHDCDHEEPYVVDGHVFYDRKAVRYVPERTCRIVEDEEGDSVCSECDMLADLIEPSEPKVKCVAEVKVDGERLEKLAHDAAVELVGVDRDALLALADEMGRVGYNDWLYSGEWEPEEIARRIRKALGAVG